MTTQSWSTRVRHDSDALFREWGSEFATRLGAVGLVQTADTGQINWTTVTKAGTNAIAGYEIWRFNDTQQGTAPIYLKVEYGTAGSTNRPRIVVTVGTGSNGSGTITGTALTSARNTVNTNSDLISDTARQSWMCVVDGFFGFHWKEGSGGQGSFFVCRTVNASGVATATGAMVVWGSGSSSALGATQALRFASPAAAYTAQSSSGNFQLAIIPQTPTSTAVGSDTQAFLAWTITPAVAPLVGICAVLSTEMASGTTFSVAMVGSTVRTYVRLPDSAGIIAQLPAGSTGGGSFCMLWE